MSVKSDGGGGGSTGGKYNLIQKFKDTGNSQRADKSNNEGSSHRRQKTPPVDGSKIKMKGLLKGLRYISQMFDPNLKEQEMEIGFPTDVKHVAHIGWDGPSVNPPSWMNEFRSVPEFSSAPLSLEDGKNTNPPTQSQWSSPDIRTGDGIQDSPARDLPELPKPSRRHQSSGDSSSRGGSRQSRKHQSTTDSPTQESTGKPRHSRRHVSSGDPSDAPRQPRRQHTSGLGVALAESPARDSGDGSPKASPKASRRRRSKGSSGGGSLRTSKTKALASAASDAEGMIGEELPALKETENEERE